METTVTRKERSNFSRIMRRSGRRSLLLWLLFLPLAFIVIVPLIYEFSMAFTLEQNQLIFPIVWIPNPISVSNFAHIFADTTLPIIRWFANSLLVALVGTTIIVFLSTLSGYAFARLEFPGRSWIFSLLLFSLMIPAAVTLIPSFLLLRDFKLSRYLRRHLAARSCLRYGHLSDAPTLLLDPERARRCCTCGWRREIPDLLAGVLAIGAWCNGCPFHFHFPCLVERSILATHCAQQPDQPDTPGRFACDPAGQLYSTRAGLCGGIHCFRAGPFVLCNLPNQDYCRDHHDRHGRPIAGNSSVNPSGNALILRRDIVLATMSLIIN